MKLKIETTAYSSVVGQGLMLKAPDGRCIGQIGLLNSTQIADYKMYSSAVAKALIELGEIEVPDQAIHPHPDAV